MHAGDGAVVIASLAEEGGKCTLALYDPLESLEPGLIVAHCFSGEQGGANGTAHLTVLGHGQRFILKLLLEGRHHRLVIKDGAGKDNLVSEFTMAHHFGKVVLGDGIGQAGGDDFKGYPLLLGGGDGLSHESGTPCPQVNGMRGIK